MACIEKGKTLRNSFHHLFLFNRSLQQSHGVRCGKKIFNIRDNYLVRRNEYTCKVTSKIYKLRGNLSCNRTNMVYLIRYKLCNHQYVGSAYKNNF